MIGEGPAKDDGIHASAIVFDLYARGGRAGARLGLSAERDGGRGGRACTA